VNDELEGRNRDQVFQNFPEETKEKCENIGEYPRQDSIPAITTVTLSIAFICHKMFRPLCCTIIRWFTAITECSFF